MMRRLFTYSASLLAGFILWLALSVVQAAFPFLAWQYPFLAIFMGMSFPGGATPTLHFLNHVAITWVPVFVAFLVARLLTRKRARFSGALILYGAFLLWSLGMALLDQLGVPIEAIFNIGLTGTVLGGAVIYLYFIDPKHP